MRILLLPFALAGGAAILRRAGGALLRLAHGGVESLYADGLASAHARRGDITSLQDAAATRVLAVRRRRLALGSFAFWAVLLLLPLITPWPVAVFAAYSPLWLLPRRRSRNA
jgi:hypothetical protein